MTKHILVVGPSVWDRESLALPRVARDHRFTFIGEEFQEYPSLLEGLRFDVFAYVRRVLREQRGKTFSGVVGTGDYPGCMLAPLLAAELGLPSPPPQAVVVLSHKFYSRQIQQRLVPHATPAFASLDPFARRPACALPFPFFVKPVKGTMSIRARMVRNAAELTSALRFTLRERLQGHLLFRPYGQLLRRYTDATVPPHHFIAEAPLTGDQVTVDGFIQNGHVVVTGIVDSVMYPGTHSFRRFEYPSNLPTSVQRRMVHITTTLMAGSGLDQTCFNVEMFHDATQDSVHVIEVNPRMSYQFADLYERVDGMNTYDAQLALATGTPVNWPTRQGRDGAAASFVLRRFTDARVTSVPTAAELSRVSAMFPGTTVKVLCHVGHMLSAQDQDVGSYRYAIINMGAPDAAELKRRFEKVEQTLTFNFA